jgi:hypothetical protein
MTPTETCFSREGHSELSIACRTPTTGTMDACTRRGPVVAQLNSQILGARSHDEIKGEKR